jgi:4-hydroxy-3-methylbut-2-enyl diphosphate reductase
MNINIDDSSGFCWGVVRTVEIVEKTLKESDGNDIYVLGHIIHNPAEISRLEKEGIKTLSKKDLASLENTNSKVIIRAHGEPPETYTSAKGMNIPIIDATCPLVKALQNKVRKYYENDWQIVIFGKKDHAEVIGLRGVCSDECVVVSSPEDVVNSVDPDKKTVLMSQTTMDKPAFEKIRKSLDEFLNNDCDGNGKADFIAQDTICKYVADREDKIAGFAESHDVIIFVAGKNSSNGKSLFNICYNANPQSYFIENESEIQKNWFTGKENVGITGATSTPRWYLHEIKRAIEEIIS